MQLIVKNHSATSTVQSNISRGVSLTVLVFAWAILSITAAFRLLGNSRDYVEYLYYYNNISQALNFGDTRFEPGFHYISWISRSILNLPYDYFVLLLVGLSLAIKFYLFKKYLRYPVLAAVTYVAIFYPTHEYTQLRAALALALGYAAIHLMIEGKNRIGLVLMAFGVLLHYSTLMLLLVYMGSLFVKGRAAVASLILGILAITLFADQLTAIALNLFGEYNPILDDYVENRGLFETISIFSINNLTLFAALCSAVFLGWYRQGIYHRTFLTLSIAAYTMVLIFANSPMIAQRLKEVLFVSIIFLIYRNRITVRNLPPVVFTWMTAAILFYLAFRERLITF